jgi:hypothetical protein
MTIGFQRCQQSEGPELIVYDPRKVLALDAPGRASPDEPDGASFGHRNDSFVCKAVTPLVERSEIVMRIVRLDNKGFNKAVVLHLGDVTSS